MQGDVVGQLVLVPQVVGIEEGYQRGLGIFDTQIAGRGNTAIAPGDDLDAIVGGGQLQQALKAVVARSILDGDQFEPDEALVQHGTDGCLQRGAGIVDRHYHRDLGGNLGRDCDDAVNGAGGLAHAGCSWAVRLALREIRVGMRIRVAV